MRQEDRSELGTIEALRPIPMLGSSRAESMK